MPRKRTHREKRAQQSKRARGMQNRQAQSPDGRVWIPPKRRAA